MESDASEYFTQVRTAYLDRYRHAVQALREKGVECDVEHWITTKPKPGSDELTTPLCFDILTTENGAQKLVMVSDLAKEGPLRVVFQSGQMSVRVYEFNWETTCVWVRLPQPHWPELDAWKKRWMNTGRAPEVDGFRGEVHYMAEPKPEAGGYLIEMDFGSAPLKSLEDLLQQLSQMGASEIEIGRSDGSGLPSEVSSQLKNPELPLPQLTALIKSLLACLPEVRSVEQLAADHLMIRTRDGSRPQHLYTSNLHRLLMRIGLEARPREIDRFIRGQRETMGPHVIPELSQLSLVIKDDRFVKNIKQNFAEMKPLLGHRLTGDLWVLCVWDSPHGMRFASTEEPAKYGLTQEQMMDRAKANYLKNRGPIELSKHGPLTVAQTRDCYDATLLVDDKWCSDMAANVEGELLACAPARHVVLLGSSANPATVYEMRGAAARIEKGGDHLISSTILVRRSGRWEVLGPPVPVAPPPAIPTQAPTNPPKANPAAAKKPWWRFC